MAGRCDEVLKWKPLNMNSIDFRLKIVKDGGLGKVESKKAYLFVGHSDHPFAQMKYTKALKELDGKIIECKFEDNQWKFMRERTDKSFPNSLNTATGNFCRFILIVVTNYFFHSCMGQHKDSSYKRETIRFY